MMKTQSCRALAVGGQNYVWLSLSCSVFESIHSFPEHPFEASGITTKVCLEKS